tara:strand:- start:1313 stop:1438 length:126 start_codon:yes stop_codon:yes gene_type:complete
MYNNDFIVLAESPEFLAYWLVNNPVNPACVIDFDKEDEDEV